MNHFNWTLLIPGIFGESATQNGNTHVAILALSALFMVVIAVIARAALGSGEAAVLPAGKFSVKAFFELIAEFITDLSVTVCGEAGRKFAPMFATIFFFIFFSNAIGLIPGMTPSTDNINTTLGMGLFAFLAYNYFGFKEHGIAYLKQLLGPVIWMAPLMLVIEIISHTVRPFSLALRLRGNMMGDHMVLGIFLDLIPVVPVVFYFLGLFVCFMQAFVFTMLTMIYVSMAISHDH